MEEQKKTYHDVIKQIQKRQFSAVYCFTGSEGFVSSMMEKQLAMATMSPELVQQNLTVFDDKKTDIHEVVGICRQVPAESDYRVVILRESSGILKSTKNRELLAYLGKPVRSTILILYWGKPDKQKNIWKTIQSHACIIHLDLRYQEISWQIKTGQFKPLYCFTGLEMYISLMMEKKLVAATVTPGLEQLNLMIFDNDETDINDVIAICRQVPMMSDYRVVILRESAGMLKSAENDVLTAYLEDPEPSTILILYWESPDKRKKLWKTIQSQACVIQFDKLTAEEFGKWLTQWCTLAGKKIAGDAMACFIERSKYLEKDSTMTMAAVYNELKKLLDFAGDMPTISRDMVLKVMPESMEENIYKMVDAVMQGKMGQALMMLNHFYLEGETPFGILGLVVAQLRTLLHLSCLRAEGRSNAAMAKAVGRPDFVVTKMLAMLGRFSRDRLKKDLKAAAKLDLDIKTGVVDPQKALDVFMMGL